MLDPQGVHSPKRHLALVSVIFNSGIDGYSIALVRWDGEPKIAMRWNGSDDITDRGNPQSRGRGTWFVVPNDLRESIVSNRGISADHQALARNFLGIR